MPEHFSTPDSLWVLLVLGLLGALMAGLTLAFSPKHRRELWYDDRNEQRIRRRAKSLFDPKPGDQ